MATINRVNGDSQLVTNVGDCLSRNANANNINTGISSPITAYKVAFTVLTANLAAELGAPNGSGVPGAIETILGDLSANATVLAYQIDAATLGSGTQQISILTERSAMSAADFTTILNASGNIGSRGNVWGGNATVTTSGGIKLA
jgi:hypothetical protein